MDQMIVNQVDLVSRVLDLPPHVWLPTTVGRTAARGLEAQLSAAANLYFLKKLIDNIKAGDTAVANMDLWEPERWPPQAKGVGVTEAPRGALGHWIIIERGKIKSYQCVVPTTWNGSARDPMGGQGAFEEAMKDTRIRIAEKPVEILRSIRSFDPCLACSTHLYDLEGKEIVEVKVQGSLPSG
jgi:hydrogenase large subunit